VIAAMILLIEPFKNNLNNHNDPFHLFLGERGTIIPVTCVGCADWVGSIEWITNKSSFPNCY
jgi:hypothetical protein